MIEQQQKKWTALRRFLILIHQSPVCQEIATRITITNAQHQKSSSTSLVQELFQVLTWTKDAISRISDDKLDYLVLRTLLTMTQSSSNDTLVVFISSSVTRLSVCLDVLTSSSSSSSGSTILQALVGLLLSKCFFDPDVEAASSLLENIERRVGFAAFDRMLGVFIHRSSSDSKNVSFSSSLPLFAQEVGLV